jgi:hypothetical protein
MSSIDLIVTSGIVHLRRQWTVQVVQLGCAPELIGGFLCYCEGKEEACG